ncbi:uncharacterized protein LOC127752393 [Frankliniella occidentalis]|uniref:Uncharacterized protein LOC127752393 n=1 Tax=Frankliniella occidentalis TaxID=133901 RepID=A0A9C6XE60_FRAOC|nr:uncharacterized protein LOC127752393 [Frankliniella occidentalis]
MSVESVEQLPDDVLVTVMQYLGVEDVLACRLVSKRFGFIALHRDVWRQRRLDKAKPCVCAVLRLAPCLEMVPYTSRMHTLGLLTTRCAVAELELTVERDDRKVARGLGAAAVAIRQQQALGRLRHLHLDIDKRVTAGDVLLRTVLAVTSDLERLVVEGMPETAYSVQQQQPCTSSLKYFKCGAGNYWGKTSSAAFATAVLAGHAATLEEVDLGKGINSLSTSRLLAGMCKLRALKCGILPEMEAVLIGHLQALGSLRCLKLDFEKEMPGSDLLMKTLLAATSDLEVLEVDGSVPKGNCSIQRRPRPSLKRFRCTSSPAFVDVVLAAHAATLEEVDLGEGDRSHSPTTARLLADLPRLRSLKCDAPPGMVALAASESLRDVYLYVYQPEDDNDYGNGAATEYLRRASHLRKVCLDSAHHNLDDGEDVFVADLIDALVSARPAGLEVLAANYAFLPPPTEALVRALPSLPALRELEVTHSPLEDELLLAITPATAPALRRIVLSTDVGGETEECLHAWVHKSSVRAVLAANPDVHIQLLDHDPYYSGDADHLRCTCRELQLDCHQHIDWQRAGPLGLYSHEVDKCPSPEDHTTDSYPWRLYSKRRYILTWLQIQ